MEFNVEKETQGVINFVRDYYAKNGLGGAILGISGGKDSGVAAAILVEALGKENVIGVTLPCHTSEEAKIDAKLVSDYYGFRLYDFDLTDTFDTFKKQLVNIPNYKEEDLKNSDINLQPRLRMATVYYLAALFSAIENKTYLVAGTSNKSELYVGYFTKGGDSVHDIAILAGFTVEEVIKIGEYLKVPSKVLYKTPDDGLSNQTDEEKLGVSYKEIADYMVDPKLVPEDVRNRITRLHNSNLHKFNIPTYQKEN